MTAAFAAVSDRIDRPRRSRFPVAGGSLRPNRRQQLQIAGVLAGVGNIKPRFRTLSKARSTLWLSIGAFDPLQRPEFFFFAPKSSPCRRPL